MAATKERGRSRGRLGAAIAVLIAAAALLLGGAAHAAVIEPAPFVTTTANTFMPGVVVVPAGSTLTYANTDPALHSLTAVDTKDGAPLFDSGLLGTAQTAQVVGVEDLAPNAAGYGFVCIIHPLMEGTLIVL